MGVIRIDRVAGDGSAARIVRGERKGRRVKSNKLCGDEKQRGDSSA
jgi:hypothetical protein